MDMKMERGKEDTIPLTMIYMNLMVMIMMTTMFIARQPRKGVCVCVCVKMAVHDGVTLCLVLTLYMRPKWQDDW